MARRPVRGLRNRLTVRDTGVGIPADKLEAVFERFRQLDTHDRRGIGLGLFISKCIVQGHGGKIWAESKLGEGSTFCVTLPVHVGDRTSGSAAGGYEPVVCLPDRTRPD